MRYLIVWSNSYFRSCCTINVTKQHWKIQFNYHQGAQNSLFPLLTTMQTAVNSVHKVPSIPPMFLIYSINNINPSQQNKQNSAIFHTKTKSIMFPFTQLSLCLGFQNPTQAPPPHFLIWINYFHIVTESQINMFKITRQHPEMSNQNLKCPVYGRFYQLYTNVKTLVHC